MKNHTTGKINLLLAFIMIFTLCLQSVPIYAEEDLNETQSEINLEEDLTKADNEEENTEDTQEIETREDFLSEEDEENQSPKIFEDTKETFENMSSLAKIPGEDFDLSTINTIGKGRNGKYYGVKTYGNTFDNTVYKPFYEITEEQYNAISKDCFMVFKRADGEAFEVPHARLYEDITTAQPNNSKGELGKVFEELQFRHHLAYRLGMFLNSDPTDGMGDVDWSIDLKKDWVIENTPGFNAPEGANTDSIYIGYNCIFNGNNHKIYRKDDTDLILYLGLGINPIQKPDFPKITMNNVTVDGGSKYMGIKVSLGTVLNLENVKVENCSTDSYNAGAGITLENDTTFTMDEESEISNCISIRRGGAIYVGDRVKAYINGGKISNNKANLGGAICSLNADSELNIKNAIFENNQTIDGDDSKNGGAIYSQSKLNIESTTFTYNSAKDNGGAIYSTKPFTLTSACIFTENSAEGKGGAIYVLNKATLTAKDNCVFKGNYADSYGGAIYSNSAPVIVENSTFTENRANFGGGIFTYGDLELTDTNLDQNTATNSGGAIAVYGSPTVKLNGVTAEKNTASQQGGALYAGKSVKSVEVKKSMFKNNEALWGGALSINCPIDIKENTVFEENFAKYYGGVIYLPQGKLSVANTNFNNNSAQVGGGIVIGSNNPEEVSVLYSNFVENQSAYGAGIYLEENTKLKVANSTFSKNEAPSGGAICTKIAGVDKEKSLLTLINCNINENIAYEGGGILTTFPTDINTCTFRGNKAEADPKDNQMNPRKTGSGGAIYVAGNKTVIKESNFLENWAYGSGGAMEINGVIRNEDAEDKPITAVKEDVKVEISDDTLFKNNIVDVGQGGAIHTIPYQYVDPIDLKNPNLEWKKEAYQNLKIAEDTNFEGNRSKAGYSNPPENFAEFRNLGFAKNSFEKMSVVPEILHKSLLNNYDINYRNIPIYVIYDGNGGMMEIAGNKVNKKEDKYPIDLTDGDNPTVEITITSSIPKREGYTFTGWLDEDNKIYKEGEKLIVGGNKIFVAQWEEDKSNVEKPENPDKPGKPEEPNKPDTSDKPNKPDTSNKPNHNKDFSSKSIIIEEIKLNKEDHYQYMIGYEDSTFEPEKDMTREEVAVMFSRLLVNKPLKGQVYNYSFTDIERDRWSITAISYMNELGIIKGYPDGTFKPTNSISRAEFAAIATRFANLSEGSKTFSDVDKDYWGYEAINRAATAGWINGYPDKTFRPDRRIKRVEVISITNQMLNRFADESYVDNNKDKISLFTDVDKNHWGYYPIIEATNGHEFERVDNSKNEIWIEVNDKSFVYDK